MEKSTGLRQLPSVDRVVNELAIEDIPRQVVTEIVRREIDSLRTKRVFKPGAVDQLKQRIELALDDIRRARIQPVINGTGIIIHTNFGRSPLPASAVERLVSVASNYTNLEYDLKAGERGSRGSHVEANLATLCGAEAATIVNNCAAALVLILKGLICPTRLSVIISRGELVQIGGGFRVPDILEASGAKLAEVGTTNKTTVRDYRNAIDSQTAMILQVHRSNFYMDGFVESPSTAHLSTLARQAELPLVVDLGSGAMFDTTLLGGNEPEPTPRQILDQGADLVCFSGDKLLGGPQAGIIAGKATLVSKLKADPFFRALRCDKLVLSVLESVADLWLSQRSQQIPIVQMMNARSSELEARGKRIIEELGNASLVVSLGQGAAQVGGGTLPRTRIASITLDLPPFQNMRVENIAAALRQGPLPVCGYISDGTFKLDLRTIFPSQDEHLIQALQALAGARR